MEEPSNIGNLDFNLVDSNDNEIGLKDFLGNWVVLYFYPKDNTVGCTLEAVEFTNLVENFDKLNCVILGVSADSIENHKRFIEDHNLKITLLSDINEEVIKRFEVENRSTFLVNPEGKIVFTWRDVDAAGHAKTVLRELKNQIMEEEGDR